MITQGINALSEQSHRLLAASTEIVVSLSGGKDSSATEMWLEELGLAPRRRLFMDTGWEDPITYWYLFPEDTALECISRLPEFHPEVGELDAREWLTAYQNEHGPAGVLTRAFGDIIRLQSGRGGMVEWVLHKRMFPSKQRRWCTDVLKAQPMRSWFEWEPDTVVNAVGVRAAESRARAALAEWEPFSPGGARWVWRAVLGWSEQDVIAIHQRHGLRPNPLYFEGFSRVGCAPCVYERKQGVRRWADTRPARIRALDRLEAKVWGLQKAHALETWRTLPIDIRINKRGAGHPPRTTPPAWFQDPSNASGACHPIMKHVAWARTSHGGRQYEIDTMDYEQDGCMRWGMCDTGGEP